MNILITHERRGDRIVKATPYIRLCRKGQTPVFLRGGQMYDEAGRPLEQIPTWVTEEISRLSARALAEVGFVETGLPKRGRGRPSKEELQRLQEIEAARQAVQGEEVSTDGNADA